MTLAAQTHPAFTPRHRNKMTRQVTRRAALPTQAEFESAWFSICQPRRGSDSNRVAFVMQTLTVLELLARNGAARCTALPSVH